VGWARGIGRLGGIAGPLIAGAAVFGALDVCRNAAFPAETEDLAPLLRDDR
jgi:hypothetical protein